MDLAMLCIGVRPASGEEVMGMDDVDVDVCGVSVNSISSLRERMSER